MTGDREDRKELFEKLAKLGFAARGVTYGLIGVLAILAAFGSGGETTGQTGALQSLADGTVGKIVLFIVGIGLFGYGVWRIISAALDLENEGGDKEGLAKRAAHTGSGLFHFALSVYAIGLVFGAAGGSSGGAESWTAKLMGMPGGVVLVGIAGLIGFIAAGAQAKKAVKEEYKDHVRIPHDQRWVDPTIKAGILSRAVVFAIIGGFLVFAAFAADPDKARGVGGALSWLQSQAWGGILLGLIGTGLAAFAFYSFLQARYRTIPDPEGAS